MTPNPSTETTPKAHPRANSIGAKSIATTSLFFALITAESLAPTPILSQNFLWAQSPNTNSKVTENKLATTSPQPNSNPRPMQIDDLFQFERYADPQLSPDGSHIYFQSTKFLDALKNQKVTNLYRLQVGSAQSSEKDTQVAPVQVTRATKSDTHPRLSPDASRLLFESSRDGTPQLYILDQSGFAEAKQLTKISTGASNGIWSPDGKRVAFLSTVRPEWSELAFDQSDAKNREFDEQTASNPVKAKTFTKLFFRHWDSYVEDKRQHLFVINADGTNCRDVTPGDRDANPTSMTFSIGDDFCFSPDGRFLIATCAPATGESWTTNYDLCRIDLENPSVNWESLTATNTAADCTPRFSPDGKKLAYRAQSKPGYEADKWELMLVDTAPDGRWLGKPQPWTSSLDRSVGEFTWVGNDALIYIAEENGATGLFSVDASKKPKRLNIEFPDLRAGQLTGLSYANDTIVVARATINAPADFYAIRTTGGKLLDGNLKATQLSKGNEALKTQIQSAVPESVQVPVEGSVNMQMWILKPPGFDPSKKWPVAYLIHGGPQGAWEDGWSYRWTPQLWAAQGYVVVLPNPRGSTGFGQKFCDEISGDWGGKCYRDLLAGLNAVKALPYVDSSRIASAGASFGGYMQDWFAVNEIAKEFRCLISHCSVYNFESMWGTTEELWFDEYEHGGLPWEIPGKYREFSPHTRAGKLGEYKTPMLVIHNDLDFRCPIGQGHELFQALQRQGVPSRFVNFPDEGHWVSKSHNSRHWHQEVFGWLTKYCPPGAR